MVFLNDPVDWSFELFGNASDSAFYLAICLPCNLVFWNNLSQIIFYDRILQSIQTLLKYAWY